jgi:hypothetical protein
MEIVQAFMNKNKIYQKSLKNQYKLIKKLTCLLIVKESICRDLKISILAQDTILILIIIVK